MKISTHTTRQPAQAIALAVVVAVLAVPAAAAGNGQPPDVFAPAVARQHAFRDTFERYAASHPYGAAAPAALGTSKPQGSTFITDTLGGNGHANTVVQGYRFITDTLAPGGAGQLAAAPSPGFNWADAGVGAGTLAGLMVVLLGGARLALRRRHTLAV